VGEDVPRPARAELPVDVRQPGGGHADGEVLVEAVLDALPSPTLLIDAAGTILLANTAWRNAAEVLGDDRFRIGVGDDYFGMAMQLRGDAHTLAIIEQVRELSRGELAVVAADYELPHPEGTRWYHLQASRVDQAGHIVVTHTDVTSRVRAERATAWRARHDHLTELPNRAYLHELIDDELQRPDRRSIAVLFLDIDGFKDVNDSLGHEVGDELLRQLAARLVAATRGQDIVGRLGGDEFVVLCRDCDTEGAEILAQRFHSAFEQPFELAGRTLPLGVSIGIAGVARTEQRPGRAMDLVRDADLAMYAAKEAGRNRVRLFTSELRLAAQQKIELAGELRDAIENGQLTLHYQPVLHLPTGEVDGAEALVRWNHPVRGLIPPDEFIPVAEEYELIDDLTRWVLGTATRQAAEWDRSGRPLIVAVNISAANLTAETLGDDVAEALITSGLPPELLVIELTESTVAENPERAAAQFAALRIAGVETAIDDFGTGFSSLAQLVNIPAGVIKIDRSLVTGAAHRGSQAAAAIAAVVGLGQACGMRSLAEGVETAEQLALARELGCTFGQGFHIARPMPAEEFARWVAARGTTANRIRFARAAGRMIIASR
jgi:diguanylate cyclase (GGDEF)-like protein